jgi:hypothetical protein
MHFSGADNWLKKDQLIMSLTARCLNVLTHDLPLSPPRSDGWLTSRCFDAFLPPLHSTICKAEGVPFIHSARVQAISGTIQGSLYFLWLTGPAIKGLVLLLGLVNC